MNRLVKDTENRIYSDRRRYRYLSAFLLLVFFCLVSFCCNVCIGSVNIPLSEIGNWLTGVKIDGTVEKILWDIRLPRTIAAFLLGGALALSGYLLQTFFHNPIAGPFTLGISSGAKMAVALVMVFFLGKGIMVSFSAMMIAAFCGAILSMGFVMALSHKVNDIAMLIVSGVMIGYICSAITDFVVTFADESDIVNLHNWSQGSFSGMNWEHIRIMAVVVSVVAVWIFLLSKPISAYQMGESYAQNCGVDVKRLRVFLVLLSSVLSACIVAFAGPISFVGVAVPHLIRSLFKTAKPILLIPACFLGGSIFCMVCDLLARVLFAPSELSISTVTAVFGAPVVLWVMLQKKREHTH